MQAAIIGVQGAGKTTLFDLLADASEHGEWAASQLMVRHGEAFIPDSRLEALASLYPEKKHTSAKLQIADVPPFAGAKKDRDEEAETLAFVRESDVLIKVVRAFENPSIPHVAGSVDASRDLADLNSELLLADLGIVERRVKKLEHSITKPTRTQKEELDELAALKPCLETLEAGHSIREVPLTSSQQKLLRGFRLLSEKPSMVVLNIGDDQFGDEELAKRIIAEGHVLLVAAELELELKQLSPDERGEFMTDYGIEELSKGRILRALLSALDLITFYTVVGQEVRAWLLPKGGTALDAAGGIHTDIARGFIRAEAVSLNDLVELGSTKEAKAQGKLRLEGREYVVQDGDVLNIRFNV